MPVRLKRAYDPAEAGDGSRYLVDRLWPRGRTATQLRLTEWLKELAPSPELREWYGHEPSRFPRFRTAYRKELGRQRGLLDRLRSEGSSGAVTLVFGARDPERSNAAVLAELLAAPGPRGRTPTASTGERWTSRELTPARWGDFERFFGRYGGVQAGCWCMFYHRDGPNGPLDDPARHESNRRDHRELLSRGRAHGILVYRNREPIGWCQFGRREELPRIEHGRKYRALAPRLGEAAAWRITCFFVDRPYRRSGVAGFALHAALQAIERRGGGIVEAYPTTRRGAVATWFGTRAMFEREGFRVVRPFGESHVLVRRRLAPKGRKR